MSSFRIVVASLTVSAAAFGALITAEGWEPVARPPVAGDVPTYGFGTTTGDAGQPLKGGESISPVKAVNRVLQDIEKYEGSLKRCVSVPLFQYEYDAYIELAYNIGTTAFCNSTLVKKLNLEDYAGACAEILRWDRFKGQPLKGLTNRRQREYRQCIGAQSLSW